MDTTNQGGKCIRKMCDNIIVLLCKYKRQSKTYKDIDFFLTFSVDKDVLDFTELFSTVKALSALRSSLHFFF